MCEWQRKKGGDKEIKRKERERRKILERKKKKCKKREFLCSEKFLGKKVCEREGRKGNQEKKKAKEQNCNNPHCPTPLTTTQPP